MLKRWRILAIHRFTSFTASFHLLKVCYVVLKLEVRSKKSLKSKKSSVAKKQAPDFEAETCIFINKETLAQVFSCECSAIFKNTFLPENLRATDSGSWW